MGSFVSRQNAAVEEADVGLNHPYKYPPRNGKYSKYLEQVNFHCFEAMYPIHSMNCFFIYISH